MKKYGRAGRSQLSIRVDDRRTTMRIDA